MTKLKCYYAHPVTIYNTREEEVDIQMLEKMGFEVLNPNQEKYDAAYKELGMYVFIDLVDMCDCVAFKSFDIAGKGIPAGVWKEICRGWLTHKPVFEIPGCIDSRVLTVDETRTIIKGKAQEEYGYSKTAG